MCDPKLIKQIQKLSDDSPDTRALATGILQAMEIDCVVVHPRSGASAARFNETVTGGIESGSFQGPYVKHPKLSTGAGDHFNAGFCLGQLAQLSVEQCLCVGTASSGYYVRHGASATLSARRSDRARL